jgi:septal ring factor EnvC (AmiA/AmiB activator)
MINISELLLILVLFSFFIFLIFIVFRGKNNNADQGKENIARFWQKIEQLELDNERLQHLLQKSELKLEKLEIKQEFLKQENLELKQEITEFEALEQSKKLELS